MRGGRPGVSHCHCRAGLHCYSCLPPSAHHAKWTCIAGILSHTALAAGCWLTSLQQQQNLKSIALMVRPDRPKEVADTSPLLSSVQPSLEYSTHSTQVFPAGLPPQGRPGQLQMREREMLSSDLGLTTSHLSPLLSPPEGAVRALTL